MQPRSLDLSAISIQNDDQMIPEAESSFRSTTSSQGTEEANVLLSVASQNSTFNSQVESSNSSSDVNLEHDEKSWLTASIAFAGSIFTHCSDIVIFTFTNKIPTTQLHAISIVILTVHMLVQKVLDMLPSILLNLFLTLGGDSSFLEANNIDTKSMWLNSEIATLEKILTDGISDAVGESSSLPTFMDRPLTSIMLPTTILSVFLLMTMTMFLIFHVIFQGFMLISSWSNSDGSVSNSPIIMAGVMFLLLMENVLPWIFFATGFYLSFSIGGTTWCLFSASTYLLWFALRGLRTLVFTRFQDVI
jgi:hypothetical protein